MAVTITKSGDGKTIKVALDAGDTSAAIPVSEEAGISCVPGSGGTMLAQASFGLDTDIAAGTATWHDWDAGTVSAKANQLLIKAKFVRFTATTQPGVGEVVL